MKDQRTYKIIGAAIEVHKELGCGFLEPVYQETLAKEFDSQNIPYRPQPIVKIFYKGSPLDKIYQPDFICFGEIIVEIKALSRLTGNEEAQVINYPTRTSRNHTGFKKLVQIFFFINALLERVYKEAEKIFAHFAQN